jgi:hypothetical protein
VSSGLFWFVTALLHASLACLPGATQQARAIISLNNHFLHQIMLRQITKTTGRSLLASTSFAQTRNVNVFAKFAESVRRQMKEHQEFQQGVKQLSETSDSIASSDAVQRAKAAAEVTGGAVKKVVQGVETIVMSEPVQKTVEMTGKVVSTVRPFSLKN